MDFETRHLKVFLTVCETMNFSTAARRLGLAQSAVSRAVADLEARIGTELFRRSTRSVRLTPAGTAFLADARDLAERLQAIGQNARLVASGQRGHLRLGVDETAFHGCCGTLARSFSARFPDAHLIFVGCDSDTQRQLLLSGDLDAGLVLGSFGGPGLDSRVLTAAPVMAVLPAALPIAARESVTWADLTGQRIILGASPGWMAFRRVLDMSAAATGGLGQVRYEMPTMPMVLDLVRAGLGISFHAGPLRAYRTEGLALKPLVSDHSTVHTSIVWSRAERNRLVEPFVALALQAMEEA
jgi:DNA-binding transcriptional LysR family regulator